MKTLIELQKEISALYDISASAIPNTSNEYTRRRTLINMFLYEWSTKQIWKELIKKVTLTQTAGEVILPTDFSKLVLDEAGYLVVGTTLYRYISLSEKIKIDSNKLYCYIEENKLKINPEPSSSTIDLYYQTKNLAKDSSDNDILELSVDTDKTKISNDEYLVNEVLSVLHLTNDEFNKAEYYKQKANSVLQEMIKNNIFEAANMQMVYDNVYLDLFEPIGGND